VNIIIGETGNDRVCGGSGNDILAGRNGANKIR
jgi:Ca2+-binding RTX toxin-like protein